MKFLVVLALTLATASAFDLRSNNIQSRSLVAPVADPEGRITNGHNATPGQFPYQVGLSSNLSLFATSWCGGSLIGNEWVLTAAHCTDGVESVTVYLGATVLATAEVKYTVTKNDIIIHPGWNNNTYKNDISLIKIPATAYSSNIKPVKLPPIARFYFSYAGEEVIASGWGRVSDNTTDNANVLQWAQMKVITNAACRRAYREVTSSNICISTAGGVSACRGDSGGALVLASSKVQVGLSSFGSVYGCTKGYPSAFTRVTSYLKWIKEHTGISY